MSSGTMSAYNLPQGGQPFTLPAFNPPRGVENPFFGGQVFAPRPSIPMNFGGASPTRFSPGQSIPMDFGLPAQSRVSSFTPSRPVYQAGAANRAYEAEQAAKAAAARQSAMAGETQLERMIRESRAKGQDPWQLQMMQGTVFEDSMFGGGRRDTNQQMQGDGSFGGGFGA